MLVFILSIIIVILFAAVIGLSAGIGVIASKDGGTSSKSFSSLDNGCSDKDEKTTGKTYQTACEPCVFPSFVLQNF